ncbi:hypothetical protein SAMN05421505_13022 [Sinosporangium album]|uniref:Uncharacterized protein n=1 Tax=Sinosporangium album TaxID=504805 RepID=A0A1G8H1L3_9ACTN|nr:hypothetical protein SAMN05421505_13022 [Sinosporangium album]
MTATSRADTARITRSVRYGTALKKGRAYVWAQRVVSRAVLTRSAAASEVGSAVTAIVADRLQRAGRSASRVITISRLST